jgi:hypothetical protein
MKHLIAKTKGAKGKYYKILTDNEIFNAPNVSDSVKYNSDYKLDDGQWFHISEFSQESYMDAFLEKQFISTEYDNISQSQFRSLSHFVEIQSNEYLYQKITPTQLLRKRYIALDNKPRIVKETSLIPIPHTVDAYYKKDEDKLYFKKLTRITTIFKGIDSIYKEATEAETAQFLAEPFIKLENDFGAKNVKKANRKRIALAMNTLNTFKPKERKSIMNYIGGYCPALKYDKSTSAYSIESEDELKQLLFGIEQRYYTTPVGGEKRVANSVLAL